MADSKQGGTLWAWFTGLFTGKARWEDVMEVDASPPAEDPAELLAHPERWETCDLGALEALVLDTCLAYGAGGDTTGMIPTLMGLYRVWCRRASPERRLALLTQVNDTQDTGRASAWTLNPFIFEEDHAGVIATATLHYAWNMPLTNPADPTSGVMQVIQQLRGAQNLPPVARAAAMRGLFSLGDRQVMRLLRPYWALIPESHIPDFVDASTGIPLAGSIELLLEWIDQAIEQDAEQHLSGFVAALVRIKTSAVVQKVVDGERRFPLHRHFDNPLYNQQEWSFQEYAQRIRPRLEALWHKEPEPKILDHALHAWGLQLPMPKHRAASVSRTSAPDDEPLRPLEMLCLMVLRDAQDNPLPPEQQAHRAAGSAIYLGLRFFLEDMDPHEALQAPSPFLPPSEVQSRNTLSFRIAESMTANAQLYAFIRQAPSVGADPIPMVAGWFLQMAQLFGGQLYAEGGDGEVLSVADFALRFTASMVQDQRELAETIYRAVEGG